MQSPTTHASPPSNPAELAARLAAVDGRIAAIDARLSEIRQRLQSLDQALAVTAQPSPGGALTARLGHWFTAFNRRAPARALASATPAVSPLS